MAAVRAAADKLESVVADDLWPLPTYRRCSTSSDRQMNRRSKNVVGCGGGAAHADPVIPGPHTRRFSSSAPVKPSRVGG